MKYQSILIVTYGRSGSTLLQGILNSIDGCLIRGENHNFIYHIFNAYKCIIDAKKMPGLKTQGAWYGSNALDEISFADHIKILLEKMLIPDKSESNITAYGFKEIRYYAVPDFFEYLSFLKQVFPRVAFIFNTRNLDDVLKSGWWAQEDKIAARKQLINLENKFVSYNNENENSFLIDYEDVIKKSDNLLKLFDFIGAEYDYEKIDQVLNTPHSYDPTQEKIKEMFAKAFSKKDS